jgi:hypothetical protein
VSELAFDISDVVLKNGQGPTDLDHLWRSGKGDLAMLGGPAKHHQRFLTLSFAAQQNPYVVQRSTQALLRARIFGLKADQHFPYGQGLLVGLEGRFRPVGVTMCVPLLVISFGQFLLEPRLAWLDQLVAVHRVVPLIREGVE